MNILVTGSKGFIGSNLIAALKEKKDLNLFYFDRNSSENDLDSFVKNADFVFHLAGVNRPTKTEDFEEVNVKLTEKILNLLELHDKRIPFIFTSSIQSLSDSSYGRSKKNAELMLIERAKRFDLPLIIFRLPNVFGKWSKPNYNSVVATFCHNISRGIPIEISDPNKCVELLYIDNLIDDFVRLIYECDASKTYRIIEKTYQITLEKLSSYIYKFHEERDNLFIPETGEDLIKYLYATYLSFLPESHFSYKLSPREDSRGSFVEFIKTNKNGQFSFFSINPKSTRGIHYHHTKSEKFLVLKGSVFFKAENILDQKKWEKKVEGSSYEVIESIPGWIHSLENLDEEIAIVMLWSNEIFDSEHPDTYQINK